MRIDLESNEILIYAENWADVAFFKHVLQVRLESCDKTGRDVSAFLTCDPDDFDDATGDVASNRDVKIGDSITVTAK